MMFLVHDKRGVTSKEQASTHTSRHRTQDKTQVSMYMYHVMYNGSPIRP